MNFHPLSLEDYKHKPITIKILKQYIETEKRDIWDSNGFIFDQEKLETFAEQTAGVYQHEGYTIFSSARYGNFVLLKNADKTFREAGDGAYFQDDKTNCRYYLAQSITDKSCWHRIRVGEARDESFASDAEAFVLSHLHKPNELLIADQLEYLLMPLPGIKLSSFWDDESLPLMGVEHLFHLLQSAVDNFQLWIDKGLIHPSLSADVLELTDTGIEIADLSSALPISLEPKLVTTIFPRLSLQDETCLSPSILSYKNLHGEAQYELAQEISVTHHDMFYALINLLAYISTGRYPSKVNRLSLLNNSGYQDEYRAQFNLEPMIGRFSSLGLCPFYKQESFVKMIVALEELYLSDLPLTAALKMMKEILATHRLQALKDQDMYSLQLQTGSQFNVWESIFNQEMHVLAASLSLGKSFDSEDLASYLGQTKILVTFLKNQWFLNAHWLDEYFEKAFQAILDPSIITALRDLIIQWQSYSDETSIWREAVANDGMDLQPELLYSLISWRLPGLNTQIGDKKMSVLHALVCAHIRSKKSNNFILLLIDELLAAGANPYVCNADGWTPLMDIAAYGQINLAMVLMKAKVYSGFRDSGGGWTAFHYAASIQTEDLAIKMMQVLQTTASINSIDKQGISPLMVLVEEKKYTAALYAIYHNKIGANPLLKDNAGSSVETLGLNLSLFPFIPEENFLIFSVDLPDLSENLVKLLAKSKDDYVLKEQIRSDEIQKISRIFETYQPETFSGFEETDFTGGSASKKMKIHNVFIDFDIHDEFNLKLLHSLEKIKHSIVHPYSANASSQFQVPGYELIHHSSQQQGWNCFDLAVGVSRQQIVEYALANKSDVTFRKLLAPEILAAIALTTSYLNEHDSISEAAEADKKDSEKVKLPVYAQGFMLPLSMHSGEIRAVFNQYLMLHEHPCVRAALSECNAAIRVGQEGLLNWEELGQFFEIEANCQAFPAAFACYQATMDEYFNPCRHSLNLLCCREDIYETYVKEYYAKNQWFAFNAVFEHEKSSSMVDIVARMLAAKISIHCPGDKIYVTESYGEREIHVAFNGENHFIGLKPIQSAEQTTAQFLSDAVSTGGFGLFFDMKLDDILHDLISRNTVYRQDDLENLLTESTSCQIEVIDTMNKDFCLMIQTSLIARNPMIEPDVLILLKDEKLQWRILFLQYAKDLTMKLKHVYYFDPLGRELETEIKSLFIQPIETLVSIAAIEPVDTGPWVVEAVKQILKDGRIPLALDIEKVRQQHQEELLLKDAEFILGL